MPWRQAEFTMAAPDSELYSGLIRLHVLHHAAKDDLFGFWMIQELGRHGYEISPGTLYPMLHGMERRGLLASRREKQDGRVRRVYRITPAGRNALIAARRKVGELFHELFKDTPCNSRSRTGRRSTRT
jgi:PadR family transcriptional regulator, regulatory protein PadR